MYISIGSFSLENLDWYTLLALFSPVFSHEYVYLHLYTFLISIYLVSPGHSIHSQSPISSLDCLRRSYLKYQSPCPFLVKNLPAALQGHRVNKIEPGSLIWASRPLPVPCLPHWLSFFPQKSHFIIVLGATGGFPGFLTPDGDHRMDRFNSVLMPESAPCPVRLPEPPLDFKPTSWTEWGRGRGWVEKRCASFLFPWDLSSWQIRMCKANSCPVTKKEMCSKLCLWLNFW